MLVDTLGIGPRARERMQLAGLVFERIVAGAFGVAPGEVRYPQLTPRAVVAGVRHVVFTRMLERRHRELTGLTDDVLDWIESYRTPPHLGLRALAAAAPAHVPPEPAVFLTREGKRARLLGSVVHLTLDEGYASLSDPQIASFAGISTEAFHRHFASKEECFLAAIDEFVHETLATVRPAMDSADSWEQAVCSSMQAFLDHLLARRALLRLAFIDLFEVGPAMVGRMTRSVDALTAMLTEQAPAHPRGGPIARDAVTGALWGIISTHVSNDRLARLPSLAEHLAFTVMAPHIGSAAAVRAVRQGGRGASR